MNNNSTAPFAELENPAFDDASFHKNVWALLEKQSISKEFPQIWMHDARGALGIIDLIRGLELHYVAFCLFRMSDIERTPAGKRQCRDSARLTAEMAERFIRRFYSVVPSASVDRSGWRSRTKRSKAKRGATSR